MNPMRQLVHLDGDLATFRAEIEAASQHDAAMAQDPDVVRQADTAMRVLVAQRRGRKRRRRG